MGEFETSEVIDRNRRRFSRVATELAWKRILSTEFDGAFILGDLDSPKNKGRMHARPRRHGFLRNSAVGRLIGGTRPCRT